MFDTANNFLVGYGGINFFVLDLRTCSKFLGQAIMFNVHDTIYEKIH